jgi:glucuronoarabinoxylan endo-1,4-beta-xylanase
MNSGTLKNGNTRIRVESLPSGVYIINGTNDKSKVSRKFVKK